MKKTKRLALFISLVIIFTSITVPMDVSAATTSVQSITLNVKPKITMYVGMKKKLKVKSVTPKGSSKKAVFTSSDSEVLKVSNTGAMEAKAEGKASITATSVTDEAVSREVSVTVKNLVKNKTYNKMVIALDKKKKTKKLSLASKVKAVNLSFASSKKKVAVVSKAGVVRVKKVGKSKITIKGKKGVVKDAKVHKQVLTQVTAFCEEQGLRVKQLTHSPIRGQEGNLEFLVHLVKTEEKGLGIDLPALIQRTVQLAHQVKP